MKVASLPEVKLIKEVFGANIVLGILSPQQENIERFFNFLCNYGATPYGCELEWMNENRTFAKIQLDEDKLFSAFQTYYYIYNKYNLGFDDNRAEKSSRRDAAEAVEPIGRDRYLREHKYITVIESSDVTKNGIQIRSYYK